ncbi:MAG: hypothetical protein ACI9HI_000906 [Salinirussus sp.]|jgi:hypothetical protein
MAKFTLFEVHLEDASLTANAPYSGANEAEADGKGADDQATGDAGEDDDSGGAGRVLVGLLVVVAILALAYLGSRRLGAGEDASDVEIEAEFET